MPRRGPMGGAVMETAVLSEIVRTLTHRGEEPRVTFWRTVAGTEVDFVVETGDGPVPIEARLSGDAPPGHGRGHQGLSGRHGKRGAAGLMSCIQATYACRWPPA